MHGPIQNKQFQCYKGSVPGDERIFRSFRWAILKNVELVAGKVIIIKHQLVLLALQEQNNLNELKLQEAVCRKDKS